MWEKLDIFEKSHNMLHMGDHVVVGLSGGPDSICLTEFLLHKREEYHLTIYAVHVNHMLRGDEAKRDEEYVMNYCKRKEIPCYVFKKDIAEYAKQSSISVEEAGRSFRYECFEKIAEEIEIKNQSGGLVSIAVAHHMNDQAETLLFRIARGTGPSGLSGMSPISSLHGRKLIRPLLALTREEVLSVLSALSEDYVTDSSNLADGHDRNVIRNHVIPTLTKMNTGVIKHISVLSDQMRELMEYMEPRLEALFLESVSLKEKGLLLYEETYRSLSTFEQKEICRRMLYRVAAKKKDITSDHVDLLRGLMDKQPGKQLNLPYGMHAVRTQNGFFLDLAEYAADEMEDHENIEIESSFLENGNIVTVSVPFSEKYHRMTFQMYHLENVQEIDFREENLKNHCIQYFDYDTIKRKLCVRTRQSGDYLVVDSQGKHKKLKRYLIDQKIASSERDRIPLLAEDSHILWVTGGRISEYYKVQRDTKRVLKVEID